MLPELWTIICHELDIYSLYNFCISYKFSYDICSKHEFWINHFKLHNVNMINKQYNFFNYINEFMVDNIINEILIMGKCNIKELKCICKNFECDKEIIKHIIHNNYSSYSLYNNSLFTYAIYVDCDYIEILFEKNPAYNVPHGINKDEKNINKLYTLLHQLCDEKIINYKTYLNN